MVDVLQRTRAQWEVQQVFIFSFVKIVFGVMNYYQTTGQFMDLLRHSEMILFHLIHLNFFVTIDYLHKPLVCPRVICTVHKHSANG